MTSNEVALTFVVPVRNAASQLERCLRSIARAAHGLPCETVVVDNGSTDGSADVASRQGVKVITSAAARVGGVRNAGVRAASGHVLAFVDADHEIDQQWVAACLEIMEDVTVGAVGYPCDAPSPPTWVQRLYDLLRGRPPRRADVRWLGAGNMAIRRDLFEAVGGFDETLVACEDVALCVEVTRTGSRIVAEPAMRSVHHGDPATLKALFFGELWRGRDNLRVSLRATGLSSLGILVPVATLLLVLAFVVLLAASPWVGWKAPAGALAGLVGLASMRTAMIIRRGRFRSLQLWLQSLAVALAFELGRGLALVAGAGHGLRTRSGSA